MEPAASIETRTPWPSWHIASRPPPEAHQRARRRGGGRRSSVSGSLPREAAAEHRPQQCPGEHAATSYAHRDHLARVAEEIRCERPRHRRTNDSASIRPSSSAGRPRRAFPGFHHVAEVPDTYQTATMTAPTPTPAEHHFLVSAARSRSTKISSTAAITPATASGQRPAHRLRRQQGGRSWVVARSNPDRLDRAHTRTTASTPRQRDVARDPARRRRRGP